MIEPEKVFIGLVDFFSVLMPGGLLAYLGKDWAAQVVFGLPAYPLDGPEQWMVFLFISYLLGHFVFLAGSTLDDWLYDPLRRLTYWGQIGRLAKGKGLSPEALRALAESRWLFGRNADQAVMLMQRVKARMLAPLGAERAVNSYQWCKARLSKENAEGLAIVQRLEADSKFFRSFFVVAVILSLVCVWQQRWLIALFCTLLWLPVLWRYVDQRFKSTQQAYWHILALAGSPEQSMPAVVPADIAYAGGLVYRTNGGERSYLFIQASADRRQWVLPKGHIEPGEDARETAVREVKEETGYWASVDTWLADIEIGTPLHPACMRVYLMQYQPDKLSEKRRPVRPEDRQTTWWTLKEARRLASYGETRELLQKIEV